MITDLVSGTSRNKFMMDLCRTRRVNRCDALEVSRTILPWWCGGVQHNSTLVVWRCSTQLYPGGVEVFNTTLPRWCGGVQHNSTPVVWRCSTRSHQFKLKLIEFLRRWMRNMARIYKNMNMYVFVTYLKQNSDPSNKAPITRGAPSPALPCSK